MPSLRWLVCIVLALLPFVAPRAPSSITLQNEYVALHFDNATLALRSISSNLHQPPYPLTSPTQPNRDWWAATLVTNTSAYTVSASSPRDSIAVKQSADRLELLWRSVVVGDKSLGYTADVGVTVVLAAHSPYAEFRYRVSATSGVLGLWSFTYSVSQLPSAQSDSDADDMFVLNHSYGALYTKPLLSQPDGLTEQYPSNNGAYQFLAHYHVVNASAFPPSHPGLYVATHDASASYKVFRYQADVSSATIGLSIELRPPNNNQPLTAHSGLQHFPFVLGCFRGDWWDASQLYRRWALSEAPWARRSIRERGSSFPEAMKRAQVWLNTGWQYHDVFNSSQGDPDVVVDRVSTIASLLQLRPQQLAVHWYVFQQSNKFDAYYPDYFPAKDGFAAAVQRLQDEGVTVAPYINGRIFDIDLAKWRDDDAQRFAAKDTPPLLGFNLSLYYEDYGNDVQQAAMCPYTDYWQQTYRNVTATLAHTYGVHGIYIDQIGAAAAQPCYDPQHNHTLGDGVAWVDGYRTFLRGAREAAGPAVAIVTESNAEPYMADLHGYLTLTAFQHDVTSRDGQLIPVFPAVYGGYMIGFGAIFTVADLVDNTDSGYATLLAAQFVYGAQLGWMSLGGTTDEPPMGLYDYLIMEQYEAELDWLRRLGTMRGLLSDYFLHGREMRQPPFVVNVTYNSTAAASPSPHSPSSSAAHCQPTSSCPASSSSSATAAYLSSAWLLGNDSSSHFSLLLLLVTPDSRVASDGLSFSLRLHLADFGIPATAASKEERHCSVWQWDESGLRSELVGRAGSGDEVDVSGSLSGRSMAVLTVDWSRREVRAVEQ